MTQNVHFLGFISHQKQLNGPTQSPHVQLNSISSPSNGIQTSKQLVAECPSFFNTRKTCANRTAFLAWPCLLAPDCLHYTIRVNLPIQLNQQHTIGMQRIHHNPHKESLPTAPVLQHANHPGPIEIIQLQLNFIFFQTDVIDNVRRSMYFISILFVCYKYIETPLSKHFLLNQSECLF